MRRGAILTILLLCAAFAAHSQDTIRTLDEVEVGSTRTPSTLRTTAPTQVTDAERIEQQGYVQLSDAVREMAGVTLKDYGGIGGMKTVSARGLGSQFSTLTIDGIAVDNSQNGQVDLGRYLLGNAAYVSLSHGQSDQQLLSATAIAAGNVINLQSAEPSFFMAEKTNLKVNTEVGSFGLLSPALLWEQKWNRRLKSSLWVNYMKSEGDYPYTYYYTADHSDTGFHGVRQHSGLRTFTADGSLFYTIAPHNTLTAKVHLTRGMHELPGNVVFYRSYPPAQYTHEDQEMLQMAWRRQKGKWHTQLLAKMQHSYDQYEDSMALGYANNYLENHYRQMQGYVSGTAQWDVAEWADLTLATDGTLGRLLSNLELRNDIVRSQLLAALSARTHHTIGKTKLQTHATLLATEVADHLADAESGPRYQRLSPYGAVMFSPNMHLTLRYFYKQTFRVPNFSELYFFLQVPRNLRPERAEQHNIGITYAAEHVAATLDVYHNRVVDKIVAMPGANMYYWSMANRDLVDIWGSDLTADLDFSPVTVHMTYSFAHAIDLSDPNDPKTYGHQLRYTPRHSGSGSLRWENKWVNLGATAFIVGHRYTWPQNSASTRLPAYADFGLSADRKIDLRMGTLRIALQVLNLLNTQYEVVKGYPMPGRNFRISMTYEI